jgi:flavin reductase (DIM6/NTAB) family NADH-FMN oxidoreductase RutF/DNA-binding IclR family transcriptional regulator
MADRQPTIDPGQYRQVLGQYPTGVCVVTSAGPDGAPAGMVVGSFSSVSLDPPLVGFFPDRGSSSWPKVAANGRFCVNILSADQEDVCRKLASKDPDKFATIAHLPSPLGSPIIDGVVAWIDCDLHSIGDAGDHFIVLGEVRQLEIATGGLPLLFFQGGYGRFSPSSLAASDRHGQLTEQLRLVDRARGRMEALAAEMSAVCVASARVDEEVVILASAGQPGAHSPATLVGQRLPFLFPTGSVFAAWMEDPAVRRWASQHAGPNRLEAVLTSLATVRDRGYSVGLTNQAQRAFVAKLRDLSNNPSNEPPTDLGELVRELAYDPAELNQETSSAVRLISAPVFNSTGTVVFALTLHDFPRPTSTEQVKQLAERLLQTAREVSESLRGGA